MILKSFNIKTCKSKILSVLVQQITGRLNLRKLYWIQLVVLVWLRVRLNDRRLVWLLSKINLFSASVIVRLQNNKQIAKIYLVLPIIHLKISKNSFWRIYKIWLTRRILNSYLQQYLNVFNKVFMWISFLWDKCWWLGYFCLKGQQNFSINTHYNAKGLK